MKLRSSDWPVFGWDTDMRSTLAAARAARRNVVLGTLIRVEGSAPRPPGTQMVFDGEQATGYFSGGCLEADVANHARDVARSGERRLLTYGQGSPWIDIRLLCSGRLEILLERIAWDDPTVSALLRLQQMRQPAFWISDGTDRRVCVAPKGTPPMSAGESHYAVRHDPSWRLLIVGGDPIAMAIAQLANLSGFETMMIRPDGPVQHPPLPGVIYSREDPRQMFETLGLDTWTAVITAMHDDEIDDAVIASALGQAPAYIGVLGAARRIKARTARLLEMGFAPDRIASVHAPIGSARCGKAPWEVAVSVLADVMERRNDQSATMDASAIPAAPSLTWVG